MITALRRKSKYSLFDENLGIKKEYADTPNACSALCIANVFNSPESLSIIKQSPFNKMRFCDFTESLLLRETKRNSSNFYCVDTFFSNFTGVEELEDDCKEVLYNVIRKDNAIESLDIRKHDISYTLVGVEVVSNNPLFHRILIVNTREGICMHDPMLPYDIFVEYSQHEVEGGYIDTSSDYIVSSILSMYNRIVSISYFSHVINGNLYAGGAERWRKQLFALQPQ